MELTSIGWNQFFENHFAPHHNQGSVPARVVLQHRDRCIVCCEQGELRAEVSGKMRHEARTRGDFPTVGDWVALHVSSGKDFGTIRALLPRKTSFCRKAVQAGGPKYGEGRAEEQILAANVDIFFLVSGLDGDFNVRRIERYLAAAWDSGAVPVVLLNKADVCEDLEAAVREAEEVAVGVPVHPMSAETGEGLEALREHLTAGTTAAFLGSSGVGKSTLINRLLGNERLTTGSVRDYDNRGRHTTTHRELLVLPGGGVVIDTPGLREIQMWSDDGGLSRTFADIEELEQQCRFSDCGHGNEPGCAIRAALEDGSLDPGRYESFLKLRQEQKRLAIRKNEKERRKAEREFDKRIRDYNKLRKELRKKGLA